jgi:apolipoprotein N-acyltransferase
MLKSARSIPVVFSGILLSFPWVNGFSGIFIFLAFVPLLWVENQIYDGSSDKSSVQIFLYASLAFFTWNILATWWIANASIAGAATAILINTFLYSVIFWLFHITRKRLGSFAGYSSLILYWTAWEYAYLNIEISWPWLNLGNALANNYSLIQWYEYTGTLGGSVWVLTINVLFFQVLKNAVTQKKEKFRRALYGSFFVILVPVGFSVFRYNTYEESLKPCQIVIVQPDFDPYGTTISSQQKILSVIHLADSVSCESANYILAPETLIDNYVSESDIDKNTGISGFRNFANLHKRTSLIFGALTYKDAFGRMNPGNLSPGLSAGKHRERYNSAIQIDSGNAIQIYHKSKLVVGVENMPYSGSVSFLKPLVEHFGGSFESYGVQPDRGVFVSSGQSARIAPVICYESVYGEFVTGFVKNGANVLFILTNDGWWGNTPGYVQHLGYARLRAIETRRSIARSASTGISAFINQRGDLVATTKWNERTAIKGSVNLNDKKTFYVIHGDIPGKIAIALSIVFLGLTLLSCFYHPEKGKTFGKNATL